MRLSMMLIPACACGDAACEAPVGGTCATHLHRTDENVTPTPAKTAANTGDDVGMRLALARLSNAPE